MISVVQQSDDCLTVILNKSCHPCAFLAQTGPVAPSSHFRTQHWRLASAYEAGPDCSRRSSESSLLQRRSSDSRFLLLREQGLVDSEHDLAGRAAPIWREGQPCSLKTCTGSQRLRGAIAWNNAHTPASPPF